MRPLKILTWHTHGSYLYYLSQAPHAFYVLSKPGRPAGFGGRCGPETVARRVASISATVANGAAVQPVPSYSEL